MSSELTCDSTESENLFAPGSSAAAAAQQEPPTIDDLLCNFTLGNTFAQFLVNRNALDNFLFLQQVYTFNAYSGDPTYMYQCAQYIIWTFVVPNGAHAIKISPTEVDRLLKYMMDPEAEKLPHTELFDIPAMEVRNILQPHLRDFLATNAWQRIEFRRTAEPTFAAVIQTPDLAAVLRRYLRHCNNATAREALAMVKFCCAAEEFRAKTYATRKTVEDDKAAEQCAKKLYREYSHTVRSMHHSKHTPYSLTVISALEETMSTCNKKAFFTEWRRRREWVGFDFKGKMLQQSKDKNGYNVPPTLAAVLAFPQCSKFLTQYLANSVRGNTLLFLSELVRVTRKYAQFFDLPESDAAAGGRKGGDDAGLGGSSSDTTDSSSTESRDSMTRSELDEIRKEIGQECRKMFDRFFCGSKPLLQCNAALVEECRKKLKSWRGAQAVTPAVLFPIGAFLFHSSERMWYRDMLMTHLYSLMDYDNKNETALFIERIFSEDKVGGVELWVFPTPDDILYNNALFDDFLDFLPGSLSASMKSFSAGCRKMRDSTPEEALADARKLRITFTDAKFTEYVIHMPCVQFVTGKIAEFGITRLNPHFYDIFIQEMFTKIFDKYYSPWVLSKPAGFFSKLDYKISPVFHFHKLITDLSFCNIICLDESNKPKMGLMKRLRNFATGSSSSGGLDVSDDKRTTATTFNAACPSLSYMASSSESSEESNASETGGAGIGIGVTVTPPPTSPSSVRRGSAITRRNSAGSTFTSASDSSEALPFHPLQQVTMYVPTFANMVESAYLRRLFDESYLISELTDDEYKLWSDLNGYFTKYHPTKDEELAQKQDAMRSDALVIVQRHESKFRSPDVLKARLDKKSLITAHFFHDEEVTLYKRFFQAFQKNLLQAGFTQI